MKNIVRVSGPDLALLLVYVENAFKEDRTLSVSTDSRGLVVKVGEDMWTPTFGSVDTPTGSVRYISTTTTVDD